MNAIRKSQNAIITFIMDFFKKLIRKKPKEIKKNMKKVHKSPKNVLERA